MSRYSPLSIVYYGALLPLAVFYMSANFWKGIVNTWGFVMLFVTLGALFITIFSGEDSRTPAMASIAVAVMQLPPIGAWIAMPNIEFGFWGHYYRVGYWGLAVHLLFLALAITHAVTVFRRAR